MHDRMRGLHHDDRMRAHRANLRRLLYLHAPRRQVRLPVMIAEVRPAGVVGRGRPLSSIT